MLTNFKDVKLNGPEAELRLPANINIAFKNFNSESLLFNLSLNKIAAAAGSACASGSLNVSHVLEAIGLEKDYAQGSIRFSLGQNNTKAEIDYVIKTLKEITTRLESL